jgi:hypothetical protein
VDQAVTGRCIPIGEISVSAGTPLPVRDPDDHYRTPIHTMLSTYNKLFYLTDSIDGGTISSDT